jgi:replicative DNA helicase
MNYTQEEIEAFRGVEQKILATCYYTRDVFDELSADDFYFDNHRKIYTACQSGEFDLDLDLTSSKFGYQSEWFFKALEASPMECPHLVKDLIEQSEKRKLGAELSKELEALRDPNYKIKSDRSISDDFLYGDKLISKCEDRWRNKVKVDMGRFDGLGRKIYSFDPGTIIILAARPGTGKTGISTQIAQEISYIEEKKWLFFSMEMTGDQFTERLAKTYFYMCNPEANIEESNQWFYNENREDGFAEAMVDHMAPNMIMVDKKGLTVDDLRKYIKSANKTWGSEIGTIVIDYAQLMKAEGTGEVEKQTIIARDLQVLSGEYPMYRYIVLVQFNRDGGKALRPTMEDIKGSSAYEDCADEIIGFWKQPGDCFTDLLVGSHLKSRQNGATGSSWFKQEGLFFRSPMEHEYLYWKEALNG